MFSFLVEGYGLEWPRTNGQREERGRSPSKPICGSPARREHIRPTGGAAKRQKGSRAHTERRPEAIVTVLLEEQIHWGQILVLLLQRQRE